MIIEGCEFPDDLYYDIENDIWVSVIDDKLYRVGLTLPFFYKVGKPTRIKPRPANTVVNRGSSLATIETPIYVGAVYSPLNGKINRTNSTIDITKDPYGSGWIVELQSSEQPNSAGLLQGEEARAKYEEKLKRERIVCFKTFPEHRLTALAETCEQILTTVGDYFFKNVNRGETLYVITQEPATEVDMIKWAEDMKQELLEIRRQDKLIHVLYRRV